jgi:hypothetical protein
LPRYGATRYLSTNFRRSRLLRELSVVLRPFLASLLDPEAAPVLLHAYCAHLARLAAVTVCAVCAGAM